MKIVIIGIRGTGKTTLAQTLEKRLNIDVLHVDKYIWDENWILCDKTQATRGIIQELDSKKDWIFEGNFTYVVDYLFKNADVILYLDYSGIEAAIGCLRRWWKERQSSRAGFDGKKPQKLEFQYLIRKALLKENRRKIEEAIEEYKPKNVKRFKNRGELNKFLKQTQLNFSSNIPPSTSWFDKLTTSQDK